MKITLFSLLSIALLAGCTSLMPAARRPSGTEQLTKQQKDIASYNSLFPHYAQVCTTTQYVRRSGKLDEEGKEILERGGNGGHATIFLKGACLDKSKGFPQ